MKILTVSCLYPPLEPNGGATIYAHSLTKEYKNKGHSVAVFAGGINPQKKLNDIYRERYQEIDIIRINLNYESFDQPIRRLVGSKKILREYTKFINEYKPDIVHFHSIQGLGINIISITKKLGIKTAITLHDSWWLCPRQFFLKSDKNTHCQQKSLSNCSLCYGLLEEKYKLIKNIRKEYELFSRDTPLINIFNSIDIKIFPSKFIYNTYSKYIKKQKNWYISQNGVEIPKIEIIKNKRNTVDFIFVGGGSKEKGADLLINTWQKYFSKNIKLNLNIYGSNINRIKNMVTAKNIHLNGIYKNSEITEIFSKNDVLIFPSVIPENSPITIKEAFSFSLPVIGSNIGGIPELIKENITGLIFNNNSEKDLSEKIIQLSDKETIKLLSKNTKSNVQYLKKQARDIINIFNRTKHTILSSPRINIINYLNQIIYFNIDTDKEKASLLNVNYWEKQIIKKISEKSILFNLDNNRTFFYENNKKIIKINSTNITKIFRSNSKLNCSTLKKQIIGKPGLNTWLEISNIIKLLKIKTIILPYDNLKPLKTINKILFLILGINNYIVFNNNQILQYKFKITFTIDKNRIIINKFIYLLNKFIKLFLYSIMLPIYIVFVLSSLLFTQYGHSRISKIFKIISCEIKKYILKIILLPLLLVKQFLSLIVRIGISQ